LRTCQSFSGPALFSPDAFEEIPAAGLARPILGNSRGLALGDYDNDGDVDVAILDNGSSVELLENVVGAKGHWVELRVLNDHGRDDIGALISLRSGPSTQWRTVQSSYSYCSSNDPRVHFGLGPEGAPPTLEVHWVDGSHERFGPLEVDRMHRLQRGSGELFSER
jgi:hypothetical protein